MNIWTCEHLNIGSLEHWKIGIFEHWNIGKFWTFEDMNIWTFTWFEDNLTQDNMQCNGKSCWQLHKIHYRCWQLIKVIKIDTSKYKTYMYIPPKYCQIVKSVQMLCRILDLIIQSSLCMYKTFTFLKPINIIHPTQSHSSHRMEICELIQAQYALSEIQFWYRSIDVSKKRQGGWSGIGMV